MKNLISYNEFGSLNENNSILKEVKDIVYSATELDDIFGALVIQYGETIPLFHATTEETAEIIKRDGLKLTYGKNYKSFSNDKNLYFQIGRCDYKSSNRPVVLRYDAPISFIEKYAYADVDSVDIDEDEACTITGRDLENETSSDARDFICSFINNGNKFEGLELLIMDLNEDEPFPEIHPTIVE